MLLGKITGKFHISWEDLWFPVDFPLSQPIENRDDGPKVVGKDELDCENAHVHTGTLQ